jgi:uncharacterized membrane protein (DUF373 family)
MHRLEGNWKTPGTSSDEFPFKHVAEFCIYLGMLHVVLYVFCVLLCNSFALSSVLWKLSSIESCMSHGFVTIALVEVYSLLCRFECPKNSQVHAKILHTLAN